MKIPFLEWLFPPKCPACGGKRPSDGALCPKCEAEYQREKRIPCRRCGKPAMTCGCRPRYDHTVVLCYLSVVRYHERSVGGRMILKLKDRKDRQVCALLGRDLAKNLQSGCILRTDALVTYVPRAKSTLLEKGVDQARELAMEVSKNCGIAFAPCLEAVADGKAQKELDAAARASHAKNSYRLRKDGSPLGGRQVILVDDVLTTGATLCACAALLKEAGAGSVICLTVGRR